MRRVRQAATDERRRWDGTPPPVLHLLGRDANQVSFYFLIPQLEHIAGPQPCQPQHDEHVSHVPSRRLYETHKAIEVAGADAAIVEPEPFAPPERVAVEQFEVSGEVQRLLEFLEVSVADAWREVPIEVRERDGVMFPHLRQSQVGVSRLQKADNGSNTLLRVAERLEMPLRIKEGLCEERNQERVLTFLLHALDFGEQALEQCESALPVGPETAFDLFPVVRSHVGDVRALSGLEQAGTGSVWQEDDGLSREGGHGRTFPKVSPRGVVFGKDLGKVARVALCVRPDTASLGGPKSLM
jgi:hypothetical protein